MTSAYGHSWTSVHGTSPQDPATGDLTVDGDTWSRALAGLTAQQVGAGLDGCLREAEDFPPSVGRFRAMCLGIPQLSTIRYELGCYRRNERHFTTWSPFTQLVWRYIDSWAYDNADAKTAERILRDAYAEARAHVMEGGDLPEQHTAIEHKPEPKPEPTDEERAASRARARKIIQEGREMLGLPPMEFREDAA